MLEPLMFLMSLLVFVVAAAGVALMLRKAPADATEEGK